VTDALMKPLESAYLPLEIGETKMKADAVVVLSGGVRDLSWLGLAAEPSEVSLERAAEGVRLYRITHLPLMLVGGSGDPTKDTISEAEAMTHAVSGLGVPGKDTIVVGKARNTLEAARAVKRMLTGNHIILVTSASHMKRAAGLFRKQGFEVIPAPCGYRGEQRAFSFISFIPRADNLLNSATALAEYLSLAWYTMIRDL
ncbi:MAG: YdcF family protein, partial [Betaproteobacteria bacterium]